MAHAERSAHRVRGRMDFTIEVVRSDDEACTADLVLRPDPRRYEIAEQDGEKFYYDKYLRYLISFEEMQASMREQMSGLPVYSLSPTIKSSPEYAGKRREAVASEIRTGQYLPPEETALPHKHIEDEPEPRGLVFVSVDICGSSALRHADPKAFDRAYQIMMRELGTVVGQFNGLIFKQTGDGFIAVIDHPCFTRQCDNAIDLGLTFLVMLRDAVNPALEDAGLKRLAIRIGADFGDAEVQRIEIPTTGYSKSDIASDALNRAVKIEQSCDANEFRIGHTLYELIHVQWLERAQVIAFDSTSVGIPNYPVYRMQ